jgi:hypothetical protein
MAQSRHKRKRRHRGTQAGTIEARGRTSRPTGQRKTQSSAKATKRKPRDRAEARQLAQERRAARFETPPTWRGALNRAGFAAALFAVLMILAFGRPVVQGVMFGAVMVLLYLPMSYYTDRFLYNRHHRQKQRVRED